MPAFPALSSCYATASGGPVAGGPGPDCVHCNEPKAAHTWVCSACGGVLARGDQQPGLHTYKHHAHMPGIKHSSVTFLLCANPQVPKPKAANYGPLPKPPPLALMAGPITVDEAWLLFGIPMKRGRKEDVKKRYLEFVSKNHPDKFKGKKQEVANAQLVRANAAWELLQRHCNW